MNSIDIKVGDGKVNLTEVNTEGKANITGENAVLKFDSCVISDTIATVTDGGTINCTLAIQHIFTLNCISSGNVYLDSVKANVSYTGVYPENPIESDVPEVSEDGVADGGVTDGSDGQGEEAVITPVSFKGDVKYGDIKISVETVK